MSDHTRMQALVTRPLVVQYDAGVKAFFWLAVVVYLVVLVVVVTLLYKRRQREGRAMTEEEHATTVKLLYALVLGAPVQGWGSGVSMV